MTRPEVDASKLFEEAFERERLREEKECLRQENVEVLLKSGCFGLALTDATELHAGQVRKDTSIPYIAHLLGVASLAFEYGPDKDGPNEDLVIAALLHDAVEDQGGIDAWSQFVDPSVLRY